MRIEPGTTGWESGTLPLCHAVPQNCHRLELECVLSTPMTFKNSKMTSASCTAPMLTVTITRLLKVWSLKFEEQLGTWADKINFIFQKQVKNLTEFDKYYARVKDVTIRRELSKALMGSALDLVAFAGESWDIVSKNDKLVFDLASATPRSTNQS